MRPRTEGLLSGLLVLLLATARAAESDGGGAPREAGAEKKPVALEEVKAAQALIDSSEIAVIGFFKDLNATEAKDYLSVVKDLSHWGCGLSTSSEVLKHFNINCSTVALFRQVDNRRDFLEIKDSKEIDATKLFRFLKINEIRLVTEYNPMSAIGLFNSSVRVHLLMFMDKSSQTQRDALKPFREAAEHLKGKVLCVLVDITVKGNQRVMAYFHVTRAQLPAAAIFHVDTEKQQVMDSKEMLAERLVDFSQRFLDGKNSKEESADSDDKIPKTEL
ncbi:endoplasmic reticulum resident protein 27 [Lissotriton helveticus]